MYSSLTDIQTELRTHRQIDRQAGIVCAFIYAHPCIKDIYVYVHTYICVYMYIYLCAFLFTRNTCTCTCQVIGAICSRSVAICGTGPQSGCLPGDSYV